MTLAASLPIIAYVGTGSSNTFSFPFPTFQQSDLTVTVGAPTPSTTTYALVLGTDYTVSGLSTSGEPALPGSIVLVANGQAWMTGADLTTGYTITIEREVPLAQTYSIRNQGDFYREVLEDALDNLEMQIQQLQVAISGLNVIPGGSGTGPGGIITYADTANGHIYALQFTNGSLTVVQIS